MNELEKQIFENVENFLKEHPRGFNFFDCYPPEIYEKVYLTDTCFTFELKNEGQSPLGYKFNRTYDEVLEELLNSIRSKVEF